MQQPKLDPSGTVRQVWGGQTPFQLLVESVKDYAIFMLDPDGHIVSWNRGAERIKGYKESEILGRHFSVFYPPADVEAGHPQGELKIARAEGRYQEEGWRVRKDGTRFMADVTITSLFDQTGILRGFAKVTRDITEKKRAEDEIQALNADLERRVEERTAKLIELNDELNAFAYSVSHDLRAPLRAIEGYAEALAEDYAETLEPDAKAYLERISAAARRMNGLIEDLLAYSRLAQAEIALQGTDLSALIDRSVQEVEPNLRDKGGHIEVRHPLPAVQAHSATLRQAITNLLSNAVKFVPAGTSPHISVRAEDRSDGKIRLWVEDNGIGIAPEHQSRIFRVFERLHGREAYPGSGIGLAIVRRSIERMGGASGVESEVGRGSRFWIELPKAEGDDSARIQHDPAR